jgi:hypothetical protein
MEIQIEGFSGQECGWKGGDRGGLAEWEQYAKEETKKKKEKRDKMKEKT